MIDIEFAYDYFSEERLFSDAFLKAKPREQYQSLNMAKNQILSQKFNRYTDCNREVLIKKAICEQALYLLETLNTQRAKLISQGVSSFSVEGVSESYDITKARNVICKEAKELIKPYLLGCASIC